MKVHQTVVDFVIRDLWPENSSVSTQWWVHDLFEEVERQQGERICMPFPRHNQPLPRFTAR